MTTPKLLSSWLLSLFVMAGVAYPTLSHGQITTYCEVRPGCSTKAILNFRVDCTRYYSQKELIGGICTSGILNGAVYEVTFDTDPAGRERVRREYSWYKDGSGSETGSLYVAHEDGNVVALRRYTAGTYVCGKPGRFIPRGDQWTRQACQEAFDRFGPEAFAVQSTPPSIRFPRASSVERIDC